MKKIPGGVYIYCPHSVYVPFGKRVHFDNENHFPRSPSWRGETQEEVLRDTGLPCSTVSRGREVSVARTAVLRPHVRRKAVSPPMVETPFPGAFDLKPLLHSSRERPEAAQKESVAQARHLSLDESSGAQY